MEREHMQIKFDSSVERNKAASRLCKQLFPVWNKPPTQGELQRIIVLAWERDLSEEQLIKAAGWWMWMRNLFIENTVTKEQKDLLKQIAVVAALGKQPVDIISARSPELLHAQVGGQGDKTLPRSRKALLKLKDIVLESEKFLPTKLTIIFADLAIDNFEAIKRVCSVEDTINENIFELEKLAREMELPNSRIVKMSELVCPLGRLGTLVSPEGIPLTQIPLDLKATKLIEIVGAESVESHRKMFGWTREKSLSHTQNIGITMGLVGQALKVNNPTGILIHNEAFIARGALNNLFNSSKDPLAVIALRDLLERKRSKD